MKENVFLGYCTECGTQIYQSMEVSQYTNVFECPNCGYPSAKGELWDEYPSYLVPQGEKALDFE